MTTPGGSAPDGAWVVGSSYGSDLTEDSIRNTVTQSPIGAWEIAQDMWKYMCQEQRKTAADLKDGQNGIKHRLDLLSDVSAYGAAVMGYNWNIPTNRWIVLPFETQLGPAKYVSIDTNGPETGFLTLKRGGLWRVDTQIAVEGFSTGIWYFNNGSIIVPIVTYTPLVPKLMLEIVNAQGVLVSAQQYDLMSDVAFREDSFFANAPRSAAFSKTFVVPHMPPEDDPEAPNHWYRVRLAIRNDPVYDPASTVRASTCTVKGGTKYSALTATLWSKDVANVNYADAVPDGGDLG